MTPEQKSALQYLVALCEAYTKTLPPPVAGPVAREVQTAISLLTPAEKPAE